MTEITTLARAVAGLIHDGDTVAMEGFTHLIPMAAGHEVIRQGRNNLTVIRMTPDLVYDQLIGMGCVRKPIFSWGGNPGVGSLHRFRDAIENGWPHPLGIEEHGHAGMASAYQAGASGLPFAVLRGYLGSDLARHNANIRSIDCPFTGERLAAVPAIRPDVAVIHAQKADRKGNVLLWGIVGVQKEAVLAARRSLVTVEEIVDDLEAPPNGLYYSQDSNQREFNLCGRFYTEADGSYSFQTLMPHSYPIPIDGPVGVMLKATKRGHFRPAHIHFRISAPGHGEVVTELYTKGDPFIDLDPVLGVKDSLTVEYKKVPEGYRLEHDFVLQAAV